MGAVLRQLTKYSFVFWAILLVFSLKLGADLRKVGYNVIPDPFIILDEYTNVWHGVSIRTSGIPAAWSILNAYTTNSEKTGAGGEINGFNLEVSGRKPSLYNFLNYPKPVIGVGKYDFGRGDSYTRLVQPYLDHPPFGAIILSLFVSKDAKTFGDVNSYDLRRAALYLAILTQALIFVLALKLTKNPLIALISSTVYGTVPSYILLSRYALLENVMAPLVLAMLIFLVSAKEKRRPIFLILAGVAAGLSALTKLSGWVFIFAGLALLVYWKFKLKNTLFFLIPGAFVGLLYFAWGLFLAPKLFSDLLLFQSIERGFIGSINLIVTLLRVNIFNFPLDGWWLGGFIALLFIPKRKEYIPIVFATIAGLFSATWLVGANYPWYFIPLIPFMCIAVGIFLYDVALSPTFSRIMFLFFVFVSSSFYWGYGVFKASLSETGYNHPFGIYRLLFVVFLCAGAFWGIVKPNRKLKRIWFAGAMALLVALAVLNRESLIFILGNWGKYPLLYTPGTF